MQFALWFAISRFRVWMRHNSNRSCVVVKLGIGYSYFWLYILGYINLFQACSNNIVL